MKRLLACTIALALSIGFASAQNIDNLYDILDLDYPGLQDVKKAWLKGDVAKADKALLKYYRSRKGIVIPELNLEDVRLTTDERKMADEALEHKFFAHKAYQPSYFYGDDIDWRYWPVKDNELRFQLHRHVWFIPLAKAYYTTFDERYSKALVEQYKDWILKNPLSDRKSLKEQGLQGEELEAELENIRFAWRPMEVSRRMQDQPIEMELLKSSSAFTPAFLNLFLRMYYQHADYLYHHYSKRGNHLLFESQRMVYAGIFFPEFKDAAAWRTSGIENLVREQRAQVYPDGVQYELDFGYHMGDIDTFLKGYHMAKANGYGDAFPSEYGETTAKMIDMITNLEFPNYTNPLFSDTRMHDKRVIKRNCANWFAVFPQKKELEWFATEGMKGSCPKYLSRMFPDGGYYVFRTGWDYSSTMVLVKAGPQAAWHNQPDNGTFNYYRAGRNFFPDSGCYVYGGDESVMADRNWFRQTRVHNTLTLDGRDLESTSSTRLLWQIEEGPQVLVTENHSYSDLRHRRSFFFLEDGVLVIADEVDGDATGEVAVHFNLAPGEIAFDRTGTLTTRNADGNNIKVKTWCSSRYSISMEEGWLSEQYRKKVERPAYAVSSARSDASPMLFITIIAPDDEQHKGNMAIAASAGEVDSQLGFDIRVGSSTYHLGYDLSSQKSSPAYIEQ